MLLEISKTPEGYFIKGLEKYVSATLQTFKIDVSGFKIIVEEENPDKALFSDAAFERYQEKAQNDSEDYTQETVLAIFRKKYDLSAASLEVLLEK